MFFTLSKVLWTLVEPANVLLIMLIAGLLLTLTRRRSFGRFLVVAATTGFLFFAVFPVGTVAIQALENRFPPQPSRALPESVNGIVVLGGMIDQFVSRARGQPSIGGAVERLTAFAELARRYPDARLVFSGGSGRLEDQSIKEADEVKPFLAVLGMDTSRIFFEAESRNTHENAELTWRALRPEPGETWILITSAFHMPRSVGSFRKVGWSVIPYPVDYSTDGQTDLSASFNLQSGLSSAATAVHEWLGLTFYYLSGRTSAWYPAPSGEQPARAE